MSSTLRSDAALHFQRAYSWSFDSFLTQRSLAMTRSNDKRKIIAHYDVVSPFYRGEVLNKNSAKTWDLSLEIIKNKSFWVLAAKQGARFVAYLKAFEAMRAGFASGNFVHGLLIGCHLQSPTLRRKHPPLLIDKIKAAYPLATHRRAYTSHSLRSYKPEHSCELSGFTASARHPEQEMRCWYHGCEVRRKRLLEESGKIAETNHREFHKKTVMQEIPLPTHPE